jgi:phosphonate transport system permease protein
MPIRLSDRAALIERHWQAEARVRRLYTVLGIGGLAVAVVLSLWFANEANAGKFFDRLPHFLDFTGDLVPRDAFEVVRALFDLPSPYDDGSLKYNYPEGRAYLTQSLYIPEYIDQMAITLNIALLSTVLGTLVGGALSFLAARNMMPNPLVRGPARRVMEILRAFPDVVVAGFFLSFLTVGPIPAIAAVSIHSIGALGKLFFEVVENADMKPDEGLRAVGGSWIERVRFAMLPQVLPNFASYFLLRLEINVRASTIIGAVGGGGIGELLRLSISQNHGAKTIAIVILLFGTIVAVDQFSAWLRRRLVGRDTFLPVT